MRFRVATLFWHGNAGRLLMVLIIIFNNETVTVWKFSSESLYSGALSPVLETFHRAFSPDPTDCPWVSEDGTYPGPQYLIACKI